MRIVEDDLDEGALPLEDDLDDGALPSEDDLDDDLVDDGAPQFKKFKLNNSEPNEDGSCMDDTMDLNGNDEQNCSLEKENGGTCVEYVTCYDDDELIPKHLLNAVERLRKRKFIPKNGVDEDFQKLMVFSYTGEQGNKYKCSSCVIRKGNKKFNNKKDFEKHIKSKVHQNYVRDHCKDRNTKRGQKYKDTMELLNLDITPDDWYESNTKARHILLKQKENEMEHLRATYEHIKDHDIPDHLMEAVEMLRQRRLPLQRNAAGEDIEKLAVFSRTGHKFHKYRCTTCLKTLCSRESMIHHLSSDTHVNCVKDAKAGKEYQEIRDILETDLSSDDWFETNNKVRCIILDQARVHKQTENLVYRSLQHENIQKELANRFDFNVGMQKSVMKKKDSVLVTTMVETTVDVTDFLGSKSFVGCEFIRPPTGFHCRLCYVDILDANRVIPHVTSNLHQENYTKHVERNPAYEQVQKQQSIGLYNIIKDYEGENILLAESQNNAKSKNLSALKDSGLINPIKLSELSKNASKRGKEMEEEVVQVSLKEKENDMNDLEQNGSKEDTLENSDQQNGSKEDTLENSDEQKETIEDTSKNSEQKETTEDLSVISDGQKETTEDISEITDEQKEAIANTSEISEQQKETIEDSSEINDEQKESTEDTSVNSDERKEGIEEKQ